MIVKLILFLLVIAAVARAEDVSTVDLQEDIQTAQNEVKTLGQKSIKDITDTYAKLVSDGEFFNSSLDRYIDEAHNVVTVTIGKMDSLKNKYIGEAIDKNKNINAFKCILKALREEMSEIQKSLAEHNQNAQTFLIKQSTELEGLKEQVQAIEMTTSGLFELLFNSTGNCENKECISNQVQKAKTRNTNVGKLMKTYNDRAADLRVHFNQNQMSTLRTLQSRCENHAKNCENKMKSC